MIGLIIGGVLLAVGVGVLIVVLNRDGSKNQATPTGGNNVPGGNNANPANVTVHPIVGKWQKFTKRTGEPESTLFEFRNDGTYTTTRRSPNQADPTGPNDPDSNEGVYTIVNDRMEKKNNGFPKSSKWIVEFDGDVMRWIPDKPSAEPGKLKQSDEYYRRVKP